ncbi:MAG: ABC transporter permease [Rhizobiales bacterium]|nr:ABC transporter permease [Hyphomicrobiales bacterium]
MAANVNESAGPGGARSAGLARSLLTSFRRNPVAMAAIAMVACILLLSVAGSHLSSWDPYATDPASRLMAPSWEHLFGTDDLGRDVLARILAGGANSTLMAFGILAIAIVVGTFVGLISGYWGGAVDELLMRVTDVFLAFPAMILAMCLAAALGPNLVNATIATGVVWWPWYARLVRAETIRIKNELYVESAIAMGAPLRRILVVHILRNGYVPVVVQASMDVGYAVLTLAGLSFIGLGAQPPLAEWGAMVSLGRDYLLKEWWMVAFPGAAIFLFVLCFNVIGEYLHGVLTSEGDG